MAAQEQVNAFVKALVDRDRPALAEMVTSLPTQVLDNMLESACKLAVDHRCDECGCPPETLAQCAEHRRAVMDGAAFITKMRVGGSKPPPPPHRRRSWWLVYVMIVFLAIVLALPR
jgi:hypothetical protein